MDGELDQLGERIAEQAAHFDAAMHRLLADLREFDERGGWHVQGAVSCAHWLAWRVGWDLVTARDRVRVARKLAEFPMIDDALRRGSVSYSKVRALMRVATPANEALLLDHARLMTASQLEKLSRKYALVQRHGQDSHPLGDEQRRYVRRRDTEDGMVKIEAVLHPEEAELVWTMLNHTATQLTRESAPLASNDSGESRGAARAPGFAVTPPLRDAAACGCDASAEARVAARVSGVAVTPMLLGAAGDGIDSPTKAPATLGAEATTSPQKVDICDTDVSAESRGVIDPTSERAPSVLHQRAAAANRAFSRADALVSLAPGYLRGDRPDRSPIEIVLTIPERSLRTDVADPTEVGEMGESFISTEAARRLRCDAGVVEAIEDEYGVPLSVGRKRRTIAGALKRALHKRDTACTFPGCTNRLFLEGHHIRHWADGGETSLMNTSMLMIRVVVVVLPVVAGCGVNIGNIQRSARVPHPGVPLSDGQPLDAPAELSAGLSNITDVIKPSIGDASQAVEVPATQMRDELRFRAGKRAQVALIYEQGFAGTSHQPDATQARVGPGDVRGYGLAVGYAIPTSTPGLSIGMTFEGMGWSVPYVEYRTCTGCANSSIFHGRAAPLTLGIGIAPSYRSSRVTYFGGMFTRNHPTSQRKSLDVDLSQQAVGDVQSGPFNLLLDAGIEVELQRWLSALVVVHQDVVANPVNEVRGSTGIDRCHAGGFPISALSNAPMSRW